MEKYNFIPNDIIYEMILNICDKYNYPSLLKNITDSLVIEKNFILSASNFTKYIQILSMFKETEEYVINLIESSFLDFKLPIKAEYYEYLIFRCILDQDFQKINSYIEALYKRYVNDYTNEKIRKAENFKGNLFLIESIINILKDLKISNNLEEISNTKINNNEEINIIVNNIIKNSQEVNNSWMLDDKFVKVICSYYSNLCFNSDELKIIIEEVSKNGKFNSVVLREIINDVFRNLTDKLLEVLKDNKEIIVRKYLGLMANLIKFHSAKISFEYKENIAKEEYLRKIFNFVKNNPNNENKEAIKYLIKEIFEAMKNGTFIKFEIDFMRRLAFSVFEDNKQVVSLFEELYSKKQIEENQ